MPLKMGFAATLVEVAVVLGWMALQVALVGLGWTELHFLLGTKAVGFLELKPVQLGGGTHSAVALKESAS